MFLEEALTDSRYNSWTATIILKEDISMAYKIGDECVSCGTCEGECPVGAIAEGDGKYEINPDVCIECGSCAAACPTGAISL